MCKKLAKMYTTLYTLLATLIVATLWLVLSTNLVLRPVAIHYKGAEVTLVRETPFGEVWGIWSTEIRVAGADGVRAGRECSSGRQRSIYQDDPDSTIHYELGEWARKCLEAGPPLVIVDTWQALLFGVIPIRPVQLVTVIEGKDATND